MDLNLIPANRTRERIERLNRQGYDMLTIATAADTNTILPDLISSGFLRSISRLTADSIVIAEFRLTGALA